MSGRLVNLANVQQYTAINLTVDPGATGGPRVIPSAAGINIVWALGSGKLALNTLVGRYSGTFAGSPAQANGIMTALTTGAQWTALAAFLAPTTSFAAIQIRDLNQPNQPIIQGTGGVVPGTSTGTELPDEVALCATFRTAFTGPQNRGRMYIPGWATNALATGNVVAAPAVTAAGNWVSIIAGALSAQGYILSVGHVARQAYTGATGTAHPARIAGTVPVTTTVIRDNHWDTQRRRGLK